MPSILPGVTTGTVRRRAPVLVVMACACISHAQAAPVKAEYQARAQVDAICSVASQIAPLSLTTTVDKNGKLDPGLVNTSFNLEGLICTGPSEITVSATSLRLTQPNTVLPPGQSQTVNFIATATGWTSIPATVTTRDFTRIGSMEIYAGVPQVQYFAKAGGITVHVGNFVVVTEKAGNGNGPRAKPVDGNYAATITISLSPRS
jgi:hypothetical protein